MSKTYDLLIEEGVTFDKLLTLKQKEYVSVGTHPVSGVATYEWQKNPIDITGFTFKAQIFNQKTSQVVAAFDISVTTAAGGQIILSMPAANTALLRSLATFTRPTDMTGTLGTYDLLASKGGTVTRLLQGCVFFSKKSTTI